VTALAIPRTRSRFAGGRSHSLGPADARHAALELSSSFNPSTACGRATALERQATVLLGCEGEQAIESVPGSVHGPELGIWIEAKARRELTKADIAAFSFKTLDLCRQAAAHDPAGTMRHAWWPVLVSSEPCTETVHRCCLASGVVLVKPGAGVIGDALFVQDELSVEILDYYDRYAPGELERRGLEIRGAARTRCVRRAPVTLPQRRPLFSNHLTRASGTASPGFAGLLLAGLRRSWAYACSPSARSRRSAVASKPSPRFPSPSTLSISSATGAALLRPNGVLDSPVRSGVGGVDDPPADVCEETSS
jgi:hypothetical protein